MRPAGKAREGGGGSHRQFGIWSLQQISAKPFWECGACGQVFVKMLLRPDRSWSSMFRSDRLFERGGDGEEVWCRGEGVAGHGIGRRDGEDGLVDREDEGDAVFE